MKYQMLWKLKTVWQAIKHHFYLVKDQCMKVFKNKIWTSFHYMAKAIKQIYSVKMIELIIFKKSLWITQNFQLIKITKDKEEVFILMV